MTAHVWQDHAKYGDHRDILADPHRKCALCRVVQHLETTHSWMRVLHKRWRPLVGRCPGK
jgi:hypothetical protein